MAHAHVIFGLRKPGRNRTENADPKVLHAETANVRYCFSISAAFAHGLRSVSALAHGAVSDGLGGWRIHVSSVASCVAASESVRDAFDGMAHPGWVYLLFRMGFCTYTKRNGGVTWATKGFEEK